MVGQEIAGGRAGRRTKLVVDAGSVDVFGRAGVQIIVENNVIAIIRELCKLFCSRNMPPDSAAEGVVNIPNLLFTGRCLGEPVFGVPCVSPEVRAFGLRRGVAVCVEIVARRVRGDQPVERRIADLWVCVLATHVDNYVSYQKQR